MAISKETNDVKVNAEHLELVETSNGTLVLENDDPDGYGQVNPSYSLPPVINIDNSNDVIIGPVTQFNGPVTILQNHYKSSSEDELASGEITSNEQNKPPTAQQNDTTSKTQSIFHHVPYKWTILISSTIIITVITVTCIIFTKPQLQQESSTQLPPINYPETTINKLGSHYLVTRRAWGGEEPLNFTKPLRHPIQYVIISHTAGTYCESRGSCSLQMQSIQSLHVQNGSPDIGYNFLIGGDADIYIARGWDIRNFHADNNIGICFIGNYVFKELSARQIEAAQMLLEEGVKTGKLWKDYRLVAHNQTYATLSPGKNVYKVIKTWKHFNEVPSDNQDSAPTTTLRKTPFLPHVPNKWVALVSLVTVIVVICVIFIKPRVIATTVTQGVIIDKLGTHCLVTREAWGGRKPENFTIPLRHPIQYVIITHTAGASCYTRATCSQLMQDIQNLDMQNGCPDIGYNFLIGGDADIYIGRGWDKRNFHANNNIEISFIGNYAFEELNQGQIEAAKLLLEEGVILGKLLRDYRVVAHNQTYITLNPVTNIYKEIKTWTNFKEGDFKNMYIMPQLNM